MAQLLNMRPDDEVEPTLEAHLLHLRKQNQRPRSIRERRLTVLRVARYLGHAVATVTRTELIAWQDDRVQTLKPAGMHNEVVHVGQFLGWMQETGRREDDPSVALVRPRKLNQRRPTPMPDSDIILALACAPQPVHVWVGLAAFCGLRCCEIATLSRDCIIGGDAPILRIIGKGGKERDVPLPAALLDELQDGGAFNPAGYLWDRLDGKPGPPSAMRVSERINDHLHSLGIVLTAHKMRHRYGTKLYEATLDPFYVAEVMGHASIDTTRGYVKIAADKRAAIEAVATLAA